MIDISSVVFDDSMSIEARVLYSFLLTQRVKMARLLDYKMVDSKMCKEEDTGLIFTIHSSEQLEKLLGCGKNKLIRVKRELEGKELIVQKRTMDGANKFFTFNKI